MILFRLLMVRLCFWVLLKALGITAAVYTSLWVHQMSRLLVLL